MSSPIIIYNIDEKTWLQYSQVPHNHNLYGFYPSSEAIDSGVMIFGGNEKTAVIEINLEGQDYKVHDTLLEGRTEHCSVTINDDVYLLGGSSKINKEIFCSCNIWNKSTNKMRSMKPMNYPKCGFSSVAVKDYIYTFGGYDGNDRLDIIERYDIKNKIWEVLEYRLPYKLTNSAAEWIGDSTVLIIGGGLF